MTPTPPADRPRGRRARRLPWLALAAPATVLLSAGLVWSSSFAAFKTTTQNGANTLTTGQLCLSDSQGAKTVCGATSTTTATAGTSLFVDTPLLQPGSFGIQCLTVKYGGNVPALVKLYGTPITTATPAVTAETYLDVKIEQVPTSTTPATCESATATSTIYPAGTDNTASELRTKYYGWGTGFNLAWTPAAQTGTATDDRQYRISWTLLNDDVAAGSQTVPFKLTWEAQNS